MLTKVFLAHPQSVDESYAQHLMFALRFSGSLFAAAGAALVHALIPCLFEKTASRMISDMHARLSRR